MSTVEAHILCEHDANNEVTCRETCGIAILEKETRVAVGHRGAQVTHRFPGP